MVCLRAISPNYQPAPKDAGFHFIQALLLLTRHLPLKEALVLLTTIPKEILIFFYTQFIQCYIMLYSFSNFHTREEIIHWIISLILNLFLNCGFIKSHRTYIITFRLEMLNPKLVLEIGVFVKHHECTLIFNQKHLSLVEYLLTYVHDLASSVLR